MLSKISYSVVYKKPHQKPATHHEHLDVDENLTIKQLKELVRKKCLEYCSHHGCELERVTINIA